MILDDYARESRKGRTYVSAAGQHAANLLRIKELGGTLGKSLEDKGRSAWLPGVKRPGWEELISRLESGQTDGVVIFDIERLLRRVEDAFYIVKLAERGFKIYDSEMEYDLQSPSGQKAFYEQAIAAQYHSHRLSTRVDRGNKDKAMRGEGRRTGIRGLGLMPVTRDGVNTVEVDETEARHVRIVAGNLLNEPGYTMQDACDYLNGEGILPATGGQWVPQSLRKALKRPTMAGYTRHKGEVVGVMHTEPVLDPVVWQQLLARFKANSGRPPSPKSLCSGVVRCGKCGGRITISTEARGKRYPDGEEVRIYRCRLDSWACLKTIGDMRVLDEAVRKLVITALNDAHTRDLLAAQAKASEEARKPILQELARLEEVRQYWGEQLNDGRITPEHHDRMISSVDAKMQKQAVQLSGIADAPMPVDIPNPLEEWKKASVPQRRELVSRAFTDRAVHVAVYPGSALETDIFYRIKLIPDAELQELISVSSHRDHSAE